MTALAAALRRHAAAGPERICLDPVGGPPVTYARLLADAGALADRLRDALDPGSPVAVRLDHGTSEVLLELALLDAGIPVLSLPSFFTPEQASRAMAVSGVQAIFEGPDPCDFARRQLPSAMLPEDTARITFTSGSTGDPKGLCLSADHMLQVAASVVEAVGARHAGRHLALLPPGVLLETVAGLFATLLAGGTYVCPSQGLAGLADPFRPDFGAMLDGIERWKITSLILVPEYLAGLVQAIEASGRRLPALTIVAVGGARVPPALVRRARALGLPVRQGYGMTEFGSVVALEEELPGEAGSAGRPLPHVTARIAADGEILLTGQRYLGAIGEPASPAGEFATGDLGRLDAQGRLWIEGRKSNLIVTSHGRNVSPEWVEEALLFQPEVAQAMVHGDGLPRPAALLVPADPNADLEAAVRRANARLPAYAQVGAWREVAHFTPMNGQLTANGRLRRRVIAECWLDEPLGFFRQLEAGTVRERLRFLSVPQVRAGLAGAITVGTYRAYLAQAWHHVRHTVPLMREARARLTDRPELVAALDEYIAEEIGHDEWILSDIRAAGGDAEAVRASEPAPATAAMIGHAYDRIRNGNPVSFFGMVYVLESVSVALAQRGASAVAESLGLPPEAFTYLTSHGGLDQEHLGFFACLVDALERREDRDAIVAMARDMFGLFGGVFAGLELEALDVAA
ncbi:AMP-dependent synthetase [Novosphingobium sp. PC22D]|uniref:AMP-binding protein n=1 Tax=Novosphingobium sp. PC22D TaxID=1962403 RepID=UPI000BF0F3CA|nr:AMP-binding protein [Novosphingobium sp. PC22D]PEQ12328.1 AMP-dependent synthetase [Novosphingobium sp. PC22D]